MQPAPPAARPPDGTYRYSLTVGGVPYESSTVVISSAPDGLRVRDALSLPAERISGTTTTLYDPRSLNQIGYSADLALPTGTQHATVSFATGAVTIAVSNQHVTVRADKSQTPLEALHQYVTVPQYMDSRVLSTLVAWLDANSAARTHSDAAPREQSLR